MSRRTGGRPPGRTGRRPAARRPARQRKGPGIRRPAAPRGTRGLRTYRTRAQGQLKRYRRGTVLAVGITGILLLLAGEAAPDVGGVTPAAAGGAAVQEPPPGADEAQAQADTAVQDTVEGDPARSVEEAAGTIQRLARQGYGALPKILIAVALLLLTGLLVRLLRLGLRRSLGRWERADALAAMVSVVLWLLALGVALSVLVGDVRALVGSIGLAGLALSWALQAPIESFTGWLLNSFRGYYRVGDRILVGDVFGDVQDIDVLTTTVWEAGGPEKPVRGAQPTGALVTFPNSEVLRANIVNYTRDFAFVWDELAVALAPESDLAYAMELIRGVADDVVGDAMAGAAQRYLSLLQARGLAHEIAVRPEVYLAPADSWTDLTVRYLVPARERRGTSTRLLLAISEAMAEPGNRERVVPGLPRQVVEQGGGEPG